MAITSVSKEGDDLIVVEDGITRRFSIRRDDTVCSLPPNGYEQVEVIYINHSTGELILQYGDETLTLSSVGGSSEFSEILLTPKASSSGAEGTLYYDSDDNHVYVGTE